jgi:FixJ family two-component response regulator
MASGQNLVVVVDDDFAVRESLKFALELEGFEVQTESSGEAFMSNPHLWNPLCLILDYRMPFMDGFEVLERLARRGASPNVILITTHLSDTLKRRAGVANVRTVLEKPLSDGALLDALHRFQAEASPPL